MSGSLLTTINWNGTERPLRSSVRHMTACYSAERIWRTSAQKYLGMPFTTPRDAVSWVFSFVEYNHGTQAVSVRVRRLAAGLARRVVGVCFPDRHPGRPSGGRCPGGKSPRSWRSGWATPSFQTSRRPHLKPRTECSQTMQISEGVHGPYASGVGLGRHPPPLEGPLVRFEQVLDRCDTIPSGLALALPWRGEALAFGMRRP